MRINDNHILESARLCLSPNHSERDGDEISLLVLHNISLPPGKFGNGYIEKFFTNKLDSSDHPYFEQIFELQVSSHLLIERNGSIIQFVPFNKKAWHAGISKFQGRENCNEFSIGIELEGTDNLDYTKNQYESLVEATKEIMKVYPAISKENIVGHSDIAPDRKTDPGDSFNWNLYLHNLV